MDAGGLSFAEFHDCLRQLETINGLTFAYPPTLGWLRPLMRQRSLSILDVASGGGDMLRRIQKMSADLKSHVTLTGIDLNPWSRQSAELSSEGLGIHYETGDVFAYAPVQPPDIILCSLFTHHLSNDQIVAYLRWADRTAKLGWFINDLHRHPVPYYFIKLATGLFSRNRMIRSDAAISVARSFTRADWVALLDQAGLADRAEIRWHFPFRWSVSCRKT